MSRPSSIQPQRNLSLTEELEKLEQSITLTLQEIDHNFSRAHRIVTTSILPIVESYATHSAAVWDGSKFWKQFFESSANVSLSGYEELASSHPPSEVSYTEEETSSMSQQTQTISPSTSSYISHSANDSQAPFSPTTPRAKTSTPTFTNQPSPYEALKAAHLGSSPPPSTPPLLPHPKADASPSSSPFPASTAASTTETGAVKGPLLHRVLDKTYRVASTPHKTASGISGRQEFSSPASSSPAPPQLHSEIFSSPSRPAARTPGVSVLTPRPKPSSKKLSKAPSAFATPKARTAAAAISHAEPSSYLSSSDDPDAEDDDDEGGSLYPAGLSPPKTIQFHIPRTQIMRTPAREASRRIVEDLMEGAGGTGGLESSEMDFEIDVGLPAEDIVYTQGKEKEPAKSRAIGLLEEDSSF